MSATTSYSYNSLGQLLRIDGPRSDVDDSLSMTYYANSPAEGLNRGQLESVRNGAGQVTTFSEYTVLGKPGSIVESTGITSKLSYNFRGDVLSRTVNGLATTYSYDGGGRLQSVTGPGGRSTSYSYAGEQLSKVSDSLGNSLVYSYDAAGRKTKEEVQESGGGSEYSVSYSYDADGNVSRVRYGDGSTEEYVYDEVGKLLHAADPLGVVNGYSYDALRRLLRASRAGETLADYSYDARDNVVEVRDARDHVTGRAYDDFGGMVEEISPDTGLRQYRYDVAGNLVSEVRGGKETVSYSYDVLNRLEGQSYPGAARNLQFTYGSNGFLSGIQGEESSESFSYNDLHQLTGVSYSLGEVSTSLGYGYDSVTTDLVSMRYPSGSELEMERDGAGRLISLRFGGQALVTGIQYLPYGPLRSASYGSLAVVRSYDKRYQLLSSQVGAVSYSYSRNAAGQVISTSGVKEPDVSSGGGVYQVNAGNNQLVGKGELLYSYDSAGNLVSDGVLSYSWDTLNRLVKVSGADGTELASYGYDANNRRIRKTVSGKTTYYVYGSGNQLVGELSSSGAVLREYVYLESEPLALIEYQTSPGVYYYINDHLGTPQQLVGQDGSVVWEAGYQPYGEAQITTGTVANNLRFPGQYYDEESGLHYNWNRYYDPETGRYVSADPIGLGGGMNLYVYVENDPVNWIDPEGLVGVGIEKPEVHGGKEHIHYGTESDPRRDGAIDREGNLQHKRDKPPNARQKKLIKKLYPGWLLRGMYPMFLQPWQIECINNPAKCAPDNKCEDNQA